MCFDSREDRRREVKSLHEVTTVDSLEDAWDRAPEVALIATPPTLHVPLALEAARRGCHLFIEKPLAGQPDDDLDELSALVKQRGLTTLVGCNMRFHPGPARVKELIDEGAVGRTLFARVFAGSYLPDWHPWEDYRRGYSANESLGGGCLLDGIHEIDLARWYLGEVETVGAMMGQLSDLELNVEDVASVLLRHVGGQQSEVHLDYVQRVGVKGSLVAGTEGAIEWDWSREEVRLVCADGTARSEELRPDGWNVNQMYVDEMAHFIGRVGSGEETCNPVDDAAVVNRIAFAIKQSSQERRFVDLSAVVA